MNKEAIKVGFLPGLIGTLCCLGPLILIMMGLISASTALSFIAYKWWFFTLSIILLVGTLWFYIKRRRQMVCNGCQTKSDERRRIITFVVFSVTASLLIFALVFYVILPWLAPIVFENFYIRR